MEKQKKVFNFNVKQIGDESERTLLMIGSTEDVDHDGDILTADGWDLSLHNKNPVVLGFHENCNFPFARSRKTYVDRMKRQLIFEIQFPTIEELTSRPDNPQMIPEHAKNVDMAYNMYRNGYMNALSVGFRGDEYEPIMEDGRYTGRKYTKQTLLEISLVPVPANQNALIQARSKGLINDIQYNEFENSCKEGTKMGVTNIVVNDENVNTNSEVGVLSANDGPYDTLVNNEPVNGNAENTEDTITGETNDTETTSDEKSFNIQAKLGASISSTNKTKLKEIYKEIGNCKKALKGCRERLKEFVMDEGEEDPDENEPDETEEEKSNNIDKTKDLQHDKQPDIQNPEEKIKALDEKMNQVLFLLQKQSSDNVPEGTQNDTENVPETTENDTENMNDDSDVEIDIDSIELPETEKDADLDELNFEPEQLKQLLNEVVKEVVQEEISKAKGGY